MKYLTIEDKIPIGNKFNGRVVIDLINQKEFNYLIWFNANITQYKLDDNCKKELKLAIQQDRINKAYSGLKNDWNGFEDNIY